MSAHEPFAALGILSAASARGSARRAAIRDSWPLLDSTVSVVVRFVLRCGNMSFEQRNDVLSEGNNMLCADSIAFRESRMRGPLLALAFWMRHALGQWPNVRFVCKADSDTWIVLPDVELHLRSIIQHDVSHGGSYAYYGCFGFFSLVDIDASAGGPGDGIHDIRPSLYAHRGFAPRFELALRLLRQYVIPDCNVSASSRCAGPFPFVYGPFLALGSAATRALLSSQGFIDEIKQLPSRIPELPLHTVASKADPKIHQPQGSSPQPMSGLATEDVWLGSALWRFVGSTLPISLYSLTDQQRYLYSDDHGHRTASRVRNAWAICLLAHHWRCA